MVSKIKELRPARHLSIENSFSSRKTNYLLSVSWKLLKSGGRGDSTDKEDRFSQYIFNSKPIKFSKQNCQKARINETWRAHMLCQKSVKKHAQTL